MQGEVQLLYRILCLETALDKSRVQKKFHREEKVRTPPGILCPAAFGLFNLIVLFCSI